MTTATANRKSIQVNATELTAAGRHRSLITISKSAPSLRARIRKLRPLPEIWCCPLLSFNCCATCLHRQIVFDRGFGNYNVKVMAPSPVPLSVREVFDRIVGKFLFFVQSVATLFGQPNRRGFQRVGHKTYERSENS